MSELADFEVLRLRRILLQTWIGLMLCGAAALNLNLTFFAPPRDAFLPEDWHSPVLMALLMGGSFGYVSSRLFIVGDSVVVRNGLRCSRFAVDDVSDVLLGPGFRIALNDGRRLTTWAAAAGPQAAGGTASQEEARALLLREVPVEVRPRTWARRAAARLEVAGELLCWAGVGVMLVCGMVLLAR